MKTGHTPGPWTMVHRPERYRIEDAPNRPAIADVYRAGQQGEGEANARLIAACPDLLAACEKMAAAQDSGGVGDVLEAMDAARAALAKAARAAP